MIDQPNNAVHVFDLAGGPATPPRHAAAISLVGTLSGFQDSGNPREGWLRFSRDGRFAYVGDAGDVIDPATRRTLTRLPALMNSRLFLEIDFAGSRPVFASSRHAVGYVGR